MWLIPDETPAQELLDVLEAAAQLDLTEFELFRNAYLYWFGDPPSDQDIEADFVDYMFLQHVPYWVTHYIRHIHREASRGVQWRSVTDQNRLPRYRWWPLLILMACLTAVILIAVYQSRLFGIVTECYFPPCF